MSILKSTRTGYKYQKWKDDLDEFASMALKLSCCLKNVSRRDVMFRVPTYKNGNDFLDEDWFEFNTGWTKEQFITAFKEYASKRIDLKRYELEDIYIPNTMILNDRA